MPYYPTIKLKTIDYPSPSGKINISKWVLPFQKVEKGFGFHGVIAEDSETGQQQCHVCGNWYELLSTHIFFKHNLISNDYRDEFGLLRSTALKSIKIRKKASETMLMLRKKHAKHRLKFSKKNKESGNRKGIPKAEESANKYGVCDLQVADRIIKLKENLGRTPSLSEVIDKYGGGFSTLIHNRYKSYIDYIQSLNMTPLFSSHNPKYSYEFFIEKAKESIRGRQDFSIKKIFTQYEQRRIYHFFGSWGNLKSIVLNELIKK